MTINLIKTNEIVFQPPCPLRYNFVPSVHGVALVDQVVTWWHLATELVIWLTCYWDFKAMQSTAAATPQSRTSHWSNEHSFYWLCSSGRLRVLVSAGQAGRVMLFWSMLTSGDSAKTLFARLFNTPKIWNFETITNKFNFDFRFLEFRHDNRIDYFLIAPKFVHFNWVRQIVYCLQQKYSTKNPVFGNVWLLEWDIIM